METVVSDEAGQEEELGEKNKKEEVKCNVCDIKFSNVSALKRHVRKFHENKSIKCHQCGKFFKTEADLESHKTLHRGFECEVCGTSFSNNNSLRTHRWRYHKKSKEGSASGTNDNEASVADKSKEEAAKSVCHVENVETPDESDSITEDSDSAEKVIDIDMY